jgi:hypothetical protein
MRALVLAALLLFTAVVGATDDGTFWRGLSPRVQPPYPPPLRGAVAPAHPRLDVHAWTIPAFGHYQTLKGIVLALAARGHNVTLVGCDATGGDAARDGLLGPQGAHGGEVGFLGLGACPSYARREEALGELVRGSPGAALQGMRELGRDMCGAAFAHFGAHAGAARLPAAIVFDGDTYCAMDVSVRWRVPRVARVGTGPRDAFSTPAALPAFSSGAALPGTSVAARVANWGVLAASRAIVAPLLLPWLYSGHRGVALEGRDGDGLARHRALALSETAMPADLPWDGVPTLLNTHWGLEHARRLAPFEHVIGHTNDFEGDAKKPLPDELRAWLRAPGGAPVVYVGLGTLAALPRDWVEALANALLSCPHARFVWSVSPTQQALLPEAARGAAVAARRCAARGACGKGGAGPGALLLVEWAPQLAVLLQPEVTVFVTHGGMNGIAEGVFARLPLLCAPFFSDQPDNCARVAERGLGAQLRLRGDLRGDEFSAALLPLLQPDAATRAALQDAWVRNVAAGGAARAVAVVEAAAALPYGAHLAEVPVEYWLPWWQREGLDIVLVVACAAAGLAWAARHCCACCCRCCCRRGDHRGNAPAEKTHKTQ